MDIKEPQQQKTTDLYLCRRYNLRGQAKGSLHRPVVLVEFCGYHACESNSCARLGGRSALLYTGSHVYLQPVMNLRLGKEIGEELTIGDVLLVSSAKLRRIRRRIGLPWRVSESPQWLSSAVRDFETFGVTDCAGAGEMMLRRAEAQIREACSILRCASWPFAKRSRKNLLQVFGPSDVAYRVLSRQIVVEKASGNPVGTRIEQRRSLIPFEINHFWHNFQTTHGWLRALSRFVDTTDIDNKWRGAVRRAASLFGESLQEPDRALAFLMDMMALDTVLLERTDRSREIFQRLDAILGWSNLGLSTPWFQAPDLKRLSDRRNDLVHDGDSSHLQPQDLILVDELLGNLLSFVCNMGYKWRARADMIQFAERVSCRRKLGVPAYAKEGKLPLKVFHPHYSSTEISKL